jgi:7-cyano-7-deazaguanine synthase
MCAIFGCLAWGLTPMGVKTVCTIMDQILVASWERGRDGWGYHVQEERTTGTGYNFERRSVERNSVQTRNDFFDTMHPVHQGVIIGNLRAEPTTEFVAQKRQLDQQPYRLAGWNIVHNGTIANDKALRLDRSEHIPTDIDSAAIVETLAGRSDFANLSEAAVWFEQCIRHLQGSYAILATHDQYPGAMFVACNYRPIWYAIVNGATFFASSRDYFPSGLSPQMVEPYSCWLFTPAGPQRLDPSRLQGQKALVVCSGGMDSVVAAKALQAEGYEVHLLHFQYGSRAETPEMAAILAVSNAMGVPLHVLPMGIYDKEDSPLLQADSEIAGGEAGAEFAHEWVPARNLVMLSLATAYAEAKGFDVIGLGNNLEEAGAYPDNEPEFINRFNDMLPFAVGDGKRLRVVMPVGNMMKHEIVALGEQLGAPMGLTWSCYRSGPLHCGTCGPCFMRRIAYEINQLPDPLQYAKKDS